MKKTKRLLFVILLGRLICTASFAFAYNQDFSITVSVPDTKSNICTEAQKMNKDLTALELTKLMGNGINLGNTMEAYRGWNEPVNQSTTFYETRWGQPVTSQIMFYAYKDAGFDTVRIPVAWTNMMDYEHGDYKINPAYLDRVEQIVNYALKADMYVIINDHWDGQWWGMFGSSKNELRTEAVKIYKSIWTQVATRFANYSEKVLFESANEELGSRLNDDTVFSNGQKGTLSEYECYNATNMINQCFVDLVRNSGGNNDYRFLLIAGFNTDIAKTCYKDFKMPTDTVSNRLLVSVHYYTPSPYCILSEDASWAKCQNSWGTKADYSVMKSTFAKMKKFTDQGYGVVVGEYGVAFQKNGTPKKGYDLWMKNVVDICEEMNLCPVLWDCNGLFKKSNNIGFITEEAAAVYKK